MTLRDRRAIRVGVVVLAAALLLRVGVPALPGFTSTRHTHADMLRRVHDIEDAIALLPKLEDSAVAMQRSLVALAPLLLGGRTRAAALTDFAGLIRSLIGQVNCQLTGLAPVQDSVRGGSLTRVTLKATLHADIRGLAAIMDALIKSQVLLVLEEARVSAASPLDGADRAERLDVELAISAWFLEAL